MPLYVRPSSVRGTIAIPPSKSHTLRAILLAGMAHGTSEIRHFLSSPDSAAMMNAMRAFGAKIETVDARLRVQGLGGKLAAAENVINAGNSGIVLRFIGALAGLSPACTTITGDHSIRHQRPVQPLLDALTQLGAVAASSPLVTIRGPIQPGFAKMQGEDSQPVSGMLIATSFLPGATTLEVTHPGEKPWIDMTLHWLKKCGIAITHQNYSRYSIPGSARIEGFSTAIPGDFSSAAFPMAAALITGSELTLTNLDMTDCQGDKKLIDILQQMGAKIDVDRDSVTIRQGNLRGMKIDVNDCIDATPILSVLGCFAEGVTEITGASIARHKESDRLRAMTLELKKMGAQIEERPDGLRIAHSPLRGAKVDDWRDHRVAMSLAIAGLGAEGETLIDGAECIAKTYPTFTQDFQAIGADIS